MNREFLKVEAVTKKLAGEVPVTLVDNTSLTLYRGQFTVINGPSGSGKSSLLYLLGLLDSPTSGRIILDGVDTAELSDDQLADTRLAHLGFVFQFHFLLPEFSALENVMLPMQKLNKSPREQIARRAQELLTSLGLEQQTHKLPKQMSGGQSQRVAIARALVNDPSAILADEPTGNLDSAASEQVQSILMNLAHREGKAVIIVSHETRMADIADRVVTIVDGKIKSDSSK